MNRKKSFRQIVVVLSVIFAIGVIVMPINVEAATSIETIDNTLQDSRYNYKIQPKYYYIDKNLKSRDKDFKKVFKEISVSGPSFSCYYWDNGMFRENPSLTLDDGSYIVTNTKYGASDTDFTYVEKYSIDGVKAWSYVLAASAEDENNIDIKYQAYEATAKYIFEGNSGDVYVVFNARGRLRGSGGYDEFQIVTRPIIVRIDAESGQIIWEKALDAYNDLEDYEYRACAFVYNAFFTDDGYLYIQEYDYLARINEVGEIENLLETPSYWENRVCGDGKNLYWLRLDKKNKKYNSFILEKTDLYGNSISSESFVLDRTYHEQAAKNPLTYPGFNILKGSGDNIYVTYATQCYKKKNKWNSGTEIIRFDTDLNYKKAIHVPIEYVFQVGITDSNKIVLFGKNMAFCSADLSYYGYAQLSSKNAKMKYYRSSTTMGSVSGSGKVTLFALHTTKDDDVLKRKACSFTLP